MNNKKELRPRDIVIKETDIAGENTLCFTCVFLCPLGEYFDLDSGISEKRGAEVKGTYHIPDDTISLTVPKNVEEDGSQAVLTEEEVSLLKLALVVHLWRLHHLLPDDFYHYCTEEAWIGSNHFGERYEYDNRFRNEVERLGYYYPYDSVGPKKHAGMRNGAVIDLMKTEENYLDGTNPDFAYTRSENICGIDCPGKEKCRKLREIRCLIADVNDIPYAPAACHHAGICSGGCPITEADIRYLEKELRKKQSKGDIVRICGISALEEVYR